MTNMFFQKQRFYGQGSLSSPVRTTVNGERLVRAWIVRLKAVLAMKATPGRQAALVTGLDRY